MAGMPHLLRSRLLVWAALALAILTVPLVAQQPTSAQQYAIRHNCRSDFQTHCSGVPTGGSAALNCLQQNAASVSPPCQQALSAVAGTSSGSAHPAQSANAPPLSRRQRAYILRQACGMDFQQNCHGVPLGGGHAIACLVSHRETLSPGCQKALASARQ